MRRLFSFGILALLLLTLSSCHKTCTCLGYDGGEYTYTAEEVEAKGVDCNKMRDFPVYEYYSVCSWD